MFHLTPRTKTTNPDGSQTAQNYVFYALKNVEIIVSKSGFLYSNYRRASVWNWKNKPWRCRDGSGSVFKIWRNWNFGKDKVSVCCCGYIFFRKLMYWTECFIKRQWMHNCKMAGMKASRQMIISACRQTLVIPALLHRYAILYLIWGYA